MNRATGTEFSGECRLTLKQGAIRVPLQNSLKFPHPKTLR